MKVMKSNFFWWKNMFLWVFFCCKYIFFHVEHVIAGWLNFWSVFVAFFLLLLFYFSKHPVRRESMGLLSSRNSALKRHKNTFSFFKFHQNFNFFLKFNLFFDKYPLLIVQNIFIFKTEKWETIRKSLDYQYEFFHFFYVLPCPCSHNWIFFTIYTRHKHVHTCIWILYMYTYNPYSECVKCSVNDIHSGWFKQMNRKSQHK